MQITLFREGTAVTTQHIELGIMRIWEKLAQIRNMVSHYEPQIQELIDKELEIFKRLYLSDQEIKYVILMGDYIVTSIWVRSRIWSRMNSSLLTARNTLPAYAL